MPGPGRTVLIESCCVVAKLLSFPKFTTNFEIHSVAGAPDFANRNGVAIDENLNNAADLATCLPYANYVQVPVKPATPHFARFVRPMARRSPHPSFRRGKQMSTVRYSTVAILLHWLIAIMVVCLFAFGLYMVDLKFSPTKLKYLSWHKWAGVTIFLLVLIRIVWRLTHKPPTHTVTMPRWQTNAAAAVHYLLYALLIAIPISGWLSSSAKGFQTVYFGVLPLPNLLDKNKELGQTLGFVHQALNYSMMAIVVLHALAALKHYFIDKDDILRRMLLGKKQ